MNNFISEKLEDFLKPKQFVGKLFYISNNFVSWPVFIFEIVEVGAPDDYKEEYIFAMDSEIAFKCKVISNDHLNEGPTFYRLDPGETFVIDKEDFDYYEVKELDEAPIAEMDQEIEKIELKKAYIQKLLNESKNSK